jgi:hypothetical protein
VIGDDVVLLAAFEVARAGFPVERVILEIDNAGVAVGRGEVVVESREFSDGAAECRMADPPVEVNDLRLVFLDKLGVAGKPVARPCVADPGPIVLEAVGVARCIEPLMRRAIERCLLRIVDIGAGSAAEGVEEVVLRAVGAESEMQTLGAHGGSEFSQRVTLRSHLDDGPIGEV